MVTSSDTASSTGWLWSGHRYLAGAAVPPAFLDVRATLEVVSREDYRELVATDDTRLLEALMTQHPRTWVARAVIDHGMTPDSVGRRAGWSRRTVYRRLAEQRETR